MNNGAIRVEKADSVGAKDPRLMAYREGLLEALAGKGWQDAMETQTIGVQKSYENGRLMGTAMRAMGVVPGEWRLHTAQPAWVYKLSDAVVRSQGHPVPLATIRS